MKVSFRIVLSILVLLGLGFFRDYVFVNINYQLYKLYYADSETQLPYLLRMLEGFNYSQLYYFKYVLTGFFLLLYVLSTLWCLNSCLPQRSNTKLIVSIFFTVTVFAGLLYFSGALFGNAAKGYQAARALLGFLQSPLPFMFLFPALLLRKN